MSAVKDIEFTQIATDWDSITLGNENPQALVAIRNGLTKKQDQDRGDYKVSRIETIGGGWIDETRVRFTSDLKDKDIEKYRIRKGDILFSHINSDPHIGKTGFAERDYDDLLHGMNLLLIRANPEVFEAEFLNRVFQYYRDIGVFISICSRSVNQSSINQAKLKALEVPLPPLPEQKKIAHILSTVQRAIEAQERIIQTTTELKKALMHKLFTEGLRNEPQKQTEIGLVPESWEVVTVQNLVDRKTLDKPIDGNHGEIHPKVADFVSEGIPFIMASDLKGGMVDLKGCNFLTKERADRLRKGFCLPGDVLISHKATIGETALVPPIEHYIMLTPQVTYYRVLDHDILSNEYLRCYFDSPAFQRPLKNIAGDGSTRAYIGITKQRSLPVLLPKIDEQLELARISERLDEKIRQVMAKKKLQNQLFRALLHELMTAKTRVNEADFSQPTLTNHA